MFHSIVDYVPSEIFIGLVTSKHLLILTHDSKLLQVDKVFGEDGYQTGEHIIVGFQDSLMMYTNNREIIHWEIISLNK